MSALFLDLLDLLTVHQGDISFDTPVVQRIVNPCGKVEKETAQVDASADHHPHGRDDAHNAGDDDTAEVEVSAPPLFRPRLNGVPDHHDHKHEQQLVD